MKFAKNGVETDASLRLRIIQRYRIWGKFLHIVTDSQGEDLDICAEVQGMKRERIPQ